jgi:hypothetical protein
MWKEWLGRTLGAHSAEDYAGRRARRSIDDADEGENLAVADGSTRDAMPDAVVRGRLRSACG